MSRIATGPDGVEHEFPDETTDDVVKRTLQKTYGAPKPPPDNSWGGMGKELIRSAGEGIASLGDLPAMIGNRINQAGPGAEFLPGGEADMPAPAAPQPMPSSRYNNTFPVTPGYEKSWTREVGNIAGPTALTLGLGSAPAIVRGAASRGLPALVSGGASLVGDTALTTAGTVAGKEGGGAVGQVVGGDTGRTWGEAIGSLGGSGLTPLVSNLVSRGLTAPNSVARFNDAELAGVKEPGLPLVGSSFASRWGSPAKQEIQQGQIDANLRDIGTAIRGSQAPGPIAEGRCRPGRHRLVQDRREDRRD
jgi:hypothetical protein